MIDFDRFPSPCYFTTSPRPKRSCSINCPGCTAIAEAGTDEEAGVDEVTRFSAFAPGGRA